MKSANPFHTKLPAIQTLEMLLLSSYKMNFIDAFIYLFICGFLFSYVFVLYHIR